MSHLPKLERRQTDVVYLDPTGHTVVLGSAGSGKTAMALSRAIYLQENCTKPGEKTLLVTFNRILISYMCLLSDELPAGLCIENYHTTARGYLSSRGKMGHNAILEPEANWQVTDRRRLVEEALAAVSGELDNVILKRPLAFFLEEVKWIAQFGVCTLDEYIGIERVGRRRRRVPRSDRFAVWRVYQKYLELRTQSGFMYDWDDIAIAMENDLRADNSAWRYRHIVIDEAQDFSPSMIRSLAAAVPVNGSLTVFGDVAQQIYGIRVSWRDAGLNLQRIERFQENYRNSPQIADLALAIADSPYYEGEPDIVRPTARQAAGPLPTLVYCPSIADEESLIIEEAKQKGRIQKVGVFFRKRDQVNRFIGMLQANDPSLSVTELHPTRGAWHWEPGVMVGTYQAAKGLEFDVVIMPQCDNSNWPNQDRIQEVGEEEACAEDIRLLYVGVTRARTSLILSFSGEVTALLPSDKKLYQYVEVL